ncbi:DoxX family protein [Serinibacter salmoneus]|uniref:Thiosulfate dehydrogenase [quinone] large subunit n=1 Tax=Serinibacter salmoneus TaxID=556530 RepID=A0A2A9D2S2_9MICO|nr:DoxX family protein [Serinibacter salmoneus]PFG20954.1 thiosulfate dehydrogenase [quinone] large subunit [Serinibacter salmoneus]
MSTTANRPAASAGGITTQEDIVTRPFARKVLAFSRILIGFFFLWPFLDKMFGLGFSTASESAVINGGTPAQGYLNFAVEDSQPLKQTFIDLFANGFGDFLFMFGLFGIGVAMIAGAGLRIAAVGGSLLMLFMYLVSLPWAAESATNPIFDSHWLEAMLLIIPAVTLAGDTWGLGKWWGNLEFVRKNPWLR